MDRQLSSHVWHYMVAGESLREMLLWTKAFQIFSLKISFKIRRFLGFEKVQTWHCILGFQNSCQNWNMTEGSHKNIHTRNAELMNCKADFNLYNCLGIHTNFLNQLISWLYMMKHIIKEIIFGLVGLKPIFKYVILSLYYFEYLTHNCP